MKFKRLIIVPILLPFLVSTACNLPGSQTQTLTPNAYTAAALTVTALAATEQAGPPKPTPTLFATFPPTAAATQTSAPPPPTSVQVTSTPSGTFFVVDVGANCRTGPGTGYDKIGSFVQGSYITLVGRSSDSAWWVVLNGSSNCWISATTGHTTGLLDNIPVVQAPPTPTLAVTATSTSGATAYP